MEDSGAFRRAVAVIVASWMLVVVPRTVQSLTAPKLRSAVGVDGPGYTALAQLSKDALTLGLLGVCAAVAVDALRRRAATARIGPLAVALAPWGYLVVRGLYEGSSPQPATLVYPAVIIAIWAIGPPIESLRVLGVLVGVTALGCMAMALLDPAAAIFRSRAGEFIAEEKEILPWGMLQGYLTQPNNLGQTLAIGLPALFLLRQRRWRAVLVAATGLALVWTASRSSLYSVAIMLVVVVALRLVRDGWRTLLGGVAIIAVAAVVVILPMITTDPTAFTNRGYIWSVSLHAWQQDPWVGHGAGWYQRIGSTAANLGSTVFHGHNQVVQLLVTGGLLLAVLVGWQYLLVARAAMRQPMPAQMVTASYLAALLGTCMMEVSLSYVDNFSMMTVVAVPSAIILFAGRFPNLEPSGSLNDRQLASGAASRRDSIRVGSRG